MCLNRQILLLKRQIIFFDIASVLQTENEVRDNYSSLNSVSTELFPVSDVVRKPGKNWNQAEESKTSTEPRRSSEERMENLEDWICFILEIEDSVPGEEGEIGPGDFIIVSQGENVYCKKDSDFLCLQCSDYQNKKL